jgi:hypothetical protein
MLKAQSGPQIDPQIKYYPQIDELFGARRNSSSAQGSRLKAKKRASD